MEMTSALMTVLFVLLCVSLAVHGIRRSLDWRRNNLERNGPEKVRALRKAQRNIDPGKDGHERCL